LRHKARIYPRTHAEEIKGGNPACVTTSNDHKVNAGAVVVATNAAVNDSIILSTRESKYRTYVIGAFVPRGSVTKALYWDTADPYHYVRIQSVGDEACLSSAVKMRESENMTMVTSASLNFTVGRASAFR
jgi:hypothetical protein